MLSLNRLLRRKIKKITVIICLFFCVALSACNKYDRIEVRISAGDWIVLDKTGAEKAYQIIQKFENGDYREIRPDDMGKGNLDFYICLKKGNSQTIYDTRGPELAKVMFDQTYHAFKVNSDFYNDLVDFYEDYFPLLYSIEYSPVDPVVYCEHDGRFTPDQESIYRLYGEIRQTAWQYPGRPQYDGSYDDEICRIIYDDTVIKETIHLFSDFKVINGRKLPVNNTELVGFILPDTEIPDAGEYTSNVYTLILKEDRTGILKSGDMEYEIKLDISRQVIMGIDGEIPYRYKDKMISFEGIGGRIYLRKER